MMKQTKAIVLSGLNVLALFTSSTGVGVTTDTLATPTAEPNTQADLNQQSLSSIESSFLDIPRICKARNAAFDPISTQGEKISSAALGIFAESLG